MAVPSPARPAIVATGSALPATVRRNDDPVFDWLHQHPQPGQDQFEGYDERRVLAPGERLADLMVESARTALQRAGKTAADVDLLTGYASFGAWAMPNDLSVVANELALPTDTKIIPVNSEYANFNDGLLIADALLTNGRATCALILVGADWTRFVDYHTAPSVSAGDGAGAAVMAMSDDPAHFRVRDVAVASDRRFLGGMYVAPDALMPPQDPPAFMAPTFHFNDIGLDAFKTFGVPGPPALVTSLLARNGLTPSDVAFIGHQTSTSLLGAWQKALQPGQFIETLATLANMTAASIPVNLDRCASQITKDHVVLVALGPEPSCTVVLLERGAGS